MTTRILILGLALCATPLAAKVVDKSACQILHHHVPDAGEGFDFAASRSTPGLVDGEAFKVRSIDFVTLPIFDLSRPDEDRWLYRVANRIHHPTQERALREALVFREGDTVTPEMLAESERVLRRKLYVHDARVLAKQRCGDEVDVAVVTRDVWTVSPRLSLARRGGANQFAIGFGDANFLGSGKAISLTYQNDVDRKGIGVSYVDPNLLGTRVRLGTQFTTNDDGGRRYVDLRRPFYSLDARYAWGLTVKLDDRVEDLYFRGESVAGFKRSTRFWELSGGLSSGRGDGTVRRMLFGLTVDDEDFAPAPDAIAPTKFPEDRSLAYPWVGFEIVEDAFERTSSFNHMGTTEDLFVGRRVDARLGWSPRSVSGDSNRMIFKGRYGDAFWVRENALFNYRVSLDGHWNQDRRELENTRASVRANFRLAQTGRLSMITGAELTYTRGLTADQQLLLGGDSGLRGYPLRYQAGDRSWRFSAEERYFSDWYLFNVLRIGAAAFVDVGRAWFPDGPNQGEYGVLADVGVGLRVECTRTQSGRVHHLDFAFPFGGEGKGFQVLLTVRETL